MYSPFISNSSAKFYAWKMKRVDDDDEKKKKKKKRSIYDDTDEIKR